MPKLDTASPAVVPRMIIQIMLVKQVLFIFLILFEINEPIVSYKIINGLSVRYENKDPGEPVNPDTYRAG